MRTEQSFVIVGGRSSEFSFPESDDYHDTILMYEPQDSSWIELPGKLKTPRGGSIAIAVDISIFPQCSNVTMSTLKAPSGKTQKTRPRSIAGDIRKRDFACQILLGIEEAFKLDPILSSKCVVKS